MLESVGIHIFKKSGEHIAGENSRYSIGSPINLKSINKLSLTFKLDIQPGMYGFHIDSSVSPAHRLNLFRMDLIFIVREDKTIEWSGLTQLGHKEQLVGKII